MMNEHKELKHLDLGSRSRRLLKQTDSFGDVPGDVGGVRTVLVCWDEDPKDTFFEVTKHCRSKQSLVALFGEEKGASVLFAVE